MVNFLCSLSKKPKLIFSIVVVLTSISIWQISQNVRLETNLKKYMPKDNSVFVYSEKAENWFNIKDKILFVIENPEGIFNHGTLTKVKEITTKLQNMGEIEKEDVFSLYTMENIRSNDDGFELKHFFEDVPTSNEKLEEIRQAVLKNDMVYGRILSKNERVTLILAELNNDITFSEEFFNSICRIADEYETPEKILITGRPIIEGTMAQMVSGDLKMMIPLVFAIIILVLYLTLRSWKSLLITIAILAMSIIWTFGFMTTLGVPIYAVSSLIPIMLIAISVAYAIYLFNNLTLYCRENTGTSKEDAVEETIRSMWKPILMASLTTAVGFISLLTSEVWPVKYFGLFSAFGVAAALFLSLVFLPASINFFGLPVAKPVNKNRSSIAHRATITIIKNKVVILSGTLVIVILSLFGIQKVWIDSSFLRNFDNDYDIVEASNVVNTNFAGTTMFNIILEGEEDTFKNPAVWEKVDSLQSMLETLPEVGLTTSLADFLKRMNRIMHADSIKYSKIPEQSDLLAQYLLLYSMAGNPGIIEKMVDYTYKRARISVNLKGDNSKIIQKAIGFVEENKNMLSGISINYAGSAYKGLVLTELIMDGQVSSIFLSIVLVIVLLTIMFRNIIAGLLGAVPIIITALISFGLMGFADIPLSIITALVGSITMGIGIDYAIHFMERYKKYSVNEKDSLVVVSRTMFHTGRAIFFNALVLIVGFSVLIISSMPPNRELGALISLNMFLSFFGTIGVMLILIHHIKPKLIK